MRAALALLALALVAPPAAAAITDPLPYEGTFEFSPEFGTGRTTLFSGSIDYTLRDVAHTAAFVNTGPVTIAGLERVCWTTAEGGACAEGDLMVTVSDGASFGIRLPTSGVRLTADHALAFLLADPPVDLDVGKSLVATLVDGNLEYGPVATIPRADGLVELEEADGIIALDGQTSFEVRRSSEVVATITGTGQMVGFEGTPAVSPFRLDAALLPFGADAGATIMPADAAAAAEGIDLGRISDVFGRLSGGEGSPPGEDPFAGAGFLQGLLNGAILAVPGDSGSSDAGGGDGAAGHGAGGPGDTGDAADTGEATRTALEELVLVRFSHLDLAGGDTATARGEAPLILEGGHVAGALPLVGIGWFALPWWSIVLWVAGLALLVARIVVRPPKKHETWDRYRWAGWAATALVTVLVVWLWDREVRAVLGFSAFDNPGADISTGLLLAVEFGILGLVMFATAVPLRLIFTNTVMLARQGRFMGLPAPAATMLGFFLSVPLLLSYLEVLLRRVLEKMA